MKRIWFILLASMVILTACSPNTVATWQEQYDLGLRYLEEGNYEEAIIAFTAAIEIDSKQAPAYVGRGDAYVLLVEDNVEEQEQNLVTYYQSAVHDYLDALELDGSMAEVYRKAAQIYVLLGDTESAIEILEQGIDITGDAELQEHLDELTTEKPLTLLTYQAAYRPDGTLVQYANYSYNEQGYLTRIEETSVNGDNVTSHVDTWEYDDEGTCLYIPDRQFYDTDEEWEEAQYEDYNEPGTNRFWGNISGDNYAVCVDPLVYEDIILNVLKHNSILENDDEGIEWDYAVYTFGDDGYPVAITTYTNGVVSGTAVLEWTTIVPAAGS